MPIYSRRMRRGERLTDRAERTQVRVLRSAARPGLHLVMAWALPDGAKDLAGIIAASGVAVVVVAEDAGPLKKAVAEFGAARVQRVAKDGASLEEQKAALREHLEADGWLLSRAGALAASAGWKLLEGGAGSVLVVDVDSPLTEVAELARLLGTPLPVRLPARARVGGIITPQ